MKQNLLCSVRFQIEFVIGPSLAAAASRQTLCFVGLGDPFRSMPAFHQTFMFFSLFPLFSLFSTAVKIVALVWAKRTSLIKSRSSASFSLVFHFTGFVTFPIVFLTMLENKMCFSCRAKKRNLEFRQRRDKNSSSNVLFPHVKLTLRSKFLFLDEVFH